jgi:hypothetical protein
LVSILKVLNIMEIVTDSGESVARFNYTHSIWASWPNHFCALFIVDLLLYYGRIIDETTNFKITTVVLSGSCHSYSMIVSREYHVWFQLLHDLCVKENIIEVHRYKRWCYTSREKMPGMKVKGMWLKTTLNLLSTVETEGRLKSPIILLTC